MPLRTEAVSRSLDRKLQIFGFEVPDVLVIFLFLAILNLIFGNSDLKLFYTWGPSIVLAVVLRIGKRGKPENYILHLVKFHTRPKYFSAFDMPTQSKPPPKISR
jgi:hypothetical protein